MSKPRILNRKRARPVEYPIPEAIPDDPENIMMAILHTPREIGGSMRKRPMGWSGYLRSYMIPDYWRMWRVHLMARALSPMTLVRYC